jgi:hypothetical protein
LADSKISALTSAAGGLADGDEFAINDVSAGASRKVTAAEIDTYLNSGRGGQRVYALGSDATANSTMTGVEITGLQAASLEAGTYVFEYFLRYHSSATGTGVKFGLNYTGSRDFIMSHAIYQTSATAASDGTHDQSTSGAAEGIVFGYTSRTVATTAPDLGPTEGVDTANADMFAYIQGVMKVTTSGDLELWHASETAASTTVKAGSSLVLTRTA